MRQSLAGLLNFWRKKQPNRLAIITSSHKITYSQLWRNASALAEVISKDDNTLIGIATSLKELTVISIVATMLCKKKFLILDPASDYFAEIIQNAKIDAIITDIESVSKYDIKIIKISNTFAGSLNKAKMNFDYSLGMDDEVGAFLSSGTTGIPKVYIRSNYSLVSEAFLWIFELQLTPKTKFFLSGPLSYIGSFVLLYSVLYAGGTVVLGSPEMSFHDFNVSYAFYTVKEINDILDNEQSIPLPVIAKKVLTMGAPIDYATKRKFADLYHCDVVEMWGNSEGLATLIDLKDKHASKGSIGRATFTDDLFITDKNGKRLMPYQVGYISGITDNGTTLEDSEIIVSEDLGYMDSDEYFYLIGRDRNVILLSENTFFSAIYFEQYLKKNSQINDCAVTIENDRFHINVFYSSLVPVEMESLCTSYLDSFGGKIVLRNIIKLDKLPYNKNGKINYVALTRHLKNDMY